MTDIPSYLLKILQQMRGGSQRRGRRPNKRRVAATTPTIEQRKLERRKIEKAAKVARKLNRAPNKRPKGKRKP